MTEFSQHEIDRIIIAFERIADSLQRIEQHFVPAAALADLPTPRAATVGWHPWYALGISAPGSPPDDYTPGVLVGKTLNYRNRKGDTIRGVPACEIDWRNTGEGWNIVEYEVTP